MDDFFPQQKVKLNLERVQQGVLFLFQRPGDLVQVRQSWLSVHQLICRLRTSRRYCAKDVPLLVWKEGEELHIKYHIPDDMAVEECVFSGEETERILAKLDGLPSWN
jgi:hypothetical protein